jgi:tetratricopeptide (TPR) repeat protein
MVRRLSLAGVVLLATCLASGGARSANDPRTEKAREHYLQGDAFYKLDKYANALQEYEQAYLAKPDPSFLYNIAQCHRLMGDKAEALKFYRRYLKDAPTAPNREVAEKHIRDLEVALATAGPASPAPAPTPPPSPTWTPTPAPGPGSGPTTPMPPPREATPSTAPPPLALNAPPPDLRNAPSGGTAVSTPPPSSDEDHPFYYKWWFWTGVGAVVVGGLVIALTVGHDPSCPAGRTCR